MGDLEEKFLKKNIPGKYSTWGDYNETPRRDDNDDDDDDNDNEAAATAAARFGCGGTSSPTTAVTGQIDAPHGPLLDPSASHNTGVKGVLSDYRQAKAFEKLQIAHDETERRDAFRNATEAAQMKPGEQSLSIAAEEMRRRREKAEIESGLGSDSDDSFLLDEDDDDFLQSYRQQRMAQMTQQSKNTSKPRTIYGTVSELDNLIQFSDVIDETTDADTYCIFHLYHPTVAGCRLTNEHLEHLAQYEMPHCRFFKLRASLVKENFDPIGFPCLLVYRDGKEIANLTPITQHFDNSSSSVERFTSEDIQCALRINGVIDA